MSLIDPLNDARPPKSHSGLERILPYTTVAMIIAVLYVAWTFYSRHEENVKETQAIAEKKADQEREAAQEIFGNGQVKFTVLSASRREVHRGESVSLCFGVVNATSLKMDPPVEPVKPVYDHCMEVMPTKTTTYTFTAGDSKGHTKTESLTIEVKK